MVVISGDDSKFYFSSSRHEKTKSDSCIYIQFFEDCMLISNLIELGDLGLGRMDWSFSGSLDYQEMCDGLQVLNIPFPKILLLNQLK